LRIQIGGESGNLLGYRASLLEGERGTAQTVHLMRRLIDQALNDAAFVRFAIDLVRNVPAYDEYGEVFSLFTWVLGHIRYTKDPVTKEKLTPPMELLKLRAGDCDDIAMLLGALAIAIGYPARFVTVAANPDYPEEFSHVYAEVEVPAGSGRWVAVDAARPGSEFGREPAVYFRKKAWSLTDDSEQDLNSATRLRGLSGYMGLGDNGGGIDWTQITAQALTETPAIIAAASGSPSSVRLPTGATVSTGNPYASFMTPYTPGYAVPAAGYGGLTSLSSSLFSGALPWLLVVGIGIALVRRSK
jgi:hypothetical protein